MMRRMLVETTLLLGLCALVMSGASKPHILLVTTDQQRINTLGCYGSSFAKSPHIDKLAATGVKYTHSYAASSSCQSSRASLVSGTQVPVHNVWSNGFTSRRKAPNFVAPLNRAGYFTAILGKTHYEPVPAFSYTDIHSGNNDKRKKNMKQKWFLETYLVDETKKLLKNEIPGARIAPGQPWFVHLSFVSPHPPTHVPVEWQGFYKNAKFPKVKYGGHRELENYPRQLKGFMPGKARLKKAFPSGKPNHQYINNLRQKYYELAAYVDAQVGRILGFLDEQNLTENTLVIFTSDHGTNLWDHGFQTKFNFFDPSWRVPLIIRGPGVPKGVTSGFAAGVDVPATIIAAAGAERPPGLNGFDLITPLLDGELASPRRNGAAAALLQGLALVTARWKFVFYLDDGYGQLFDLVADPDELVNLFDEPAHLQVQSHLLTTLLLWRAGLDPVGFLQKHESGPGQFGNTKFVYGYTMNLTGLEPEIELQNGLDDPILHGSSMNHLISS